MTREQKIAKARELRGQGLTAREIAERIGAYESTVRNWYLGGTCACGAPIDGSSRVKAPRRCAECERTRFAERNRRLVEMWEAGEPTWYIAEKLGMTETAVTSWVEVERKQHGASLSLRKLGGNAAERKDRHRQMIEWWREGKSNAEIAELAGMTNANCVNQTFVMMRRKGWDVPAATYHHHRGGRSPELATDEKLIALLKDGLTYQEIADECGYATHSGPYGRIKKLREKGLVAA